jgi:hypothetical protein
MDLATFLVELVPSIPPESIRDWAFLVILIPMAARLIFLNEPYSKFRKLFPTDGRKAFSLVRKLRIPGFEKFLRHQLAIILLPGLIALPILFYSGLDQLTWVDLPSNVAAIGSAGLLIWVITEIHRANQVRKKLDDAVEDLRQILETIHEKIPLAERKFKDLSSTLPYLEHLVTIRTAIYATTKWKQSQSSEINYFPFIGILGKEISSIIQEQVAIPLEDAAKKLISNFSDNVIDRIDEKLGDWFRPYIDSNTQETVQLILRSSAPSIWLGILVSFTGVTA